MNIFHRKSKDSIVLSWKTVKRMVGYPKTIYNATDSMTCISIMAGCDIFGYCWLVHLLYCEIY